MDAQWSLVSVYDGDSFHVNGTFTGELPFGLAGYEGRSCGLLIRVQEMVRVVKCNAPEMDTAAGRTARDAVRQWFAANTDIRNVTLELAGRDKYKRLLADVVGVNGDRLSGFVLSLPGAVPMKLAAQVTDG